MNWRLIKEAGRYLAFNYLSLFLNIMRGILLIGFLNPVSLGFYRLIFTYSSYFRYSNLGLSALAFYRAPLKGMQDVYSSLIIRTNSFLAVTLGLIFTLFFRSLWPTEIAESFNIYLCLFLLLFVTQMGETFLTVAKINNKFRIVNAYTFILALFAFLLTLSFAYLWKLNGAVAGLTIAAVIATVYIFIHFRQGITKGVNLSFIRLKILFGNSILTILPGMLLVLFSSVEVWLVTYKYGVRETGLYSVVLAIINVLLVANADSIVFLYANQAKKFKNDKNFILKTTLISFGIQMLLAGALLFLLPLTVNVLFPEYLRSSDIYRLCFWGIPFLVARNLVIHYISHNKTVGISLILLTFVIVKVLLLYVIESKIMFYKALALSNCVFGVGIFLIYSFNCFLHPKSYSEEHLRRNE